MANNINDAVACVKRATNDTLIGPDWAINIDLCDIINMDPRQAKDALKLLKKRLGSKSPKTQLLALFVIETLSKNCGDHVFQQMVERDILRDMVKIVKKKPDLNIREKILNLIDSWQEALGGPRGRYPQYYGAYNELRAAGVEFPPREDNSVAIFTPQTQPTSFPSAAYPHSEYEEAAVEASLNSDAAAAELSLSEIQNAEELTDVFMQMLSALDPKNSQDLKQEVIVDLVEQCRAFQTRVMNLVNNSIDEELLIKGLALNDNLQRVLTKYEDMEKGISVSEPRTQETLVPPPTNVNHEDDECEDDFSQLSHRSSRDNNNGLGRKPAKGRNKPVHVSPVLPTLPTHPTDSPNPSPSPAMDDFINPFTRTTHPTNSPKLLPSPAKDDFINPFTGRPAYEYDLSPSSKSSDHLPPPPPKYSQRQHFFDQQQGHSSSSSSNDGGLVEQTQKMTLKPATANKQKDQEDILFKDLVDFAKSKSSSSTSKG